LTCIPLGGILAGMKQQQHRLNRLTGQLERLKADIASGRDCTDVIPQFLAVKGALDKSFVAYVESMLEECATGKDEAKTRRLIAMLLTK